MSARAKASGPGRSQRLLGALQSVVGLLTICAVLMVALMSNRSLGSYGWALIVVLGVGSLLVAIPRSTTRRLGELVWRGLLVTTLLWSQVLLASQNPEAAGQVLAVAAVVALAVFLVHALQQFDIATERRREESRRLVEQQLINDKLDRLLQSNGVVQPSGRPRSGAIGVAAALVLTGVVLVRWLGSHRKTRA